MHGNLALRDPYRLGQNTPAGRLLGKERAGLAISFLGDRGSMVVRDPLTPANNFNGVPFDKLTYSSPSVKMCMQADGVLRYGAHNLAVQSESTSGWAAYNGGTPTLTQGTVDPFGGTKAFSLTTDAAFRGVQRNGSATWVGQGALTIWLRSPSGTKTGALQAQGTNGTGLKTFSVGTTWTKFEGATSATAPDGTTVYVIIYLDAAGTVEFAFPQLNRTPAQSAYLPTTSAAAYELPYEYTAAGVPLGIRIEEARTNLCLYSDDLTNAAWVALLMTTAKTATGADGAANSATTLTATSANATILQTIVSGSAARITSCYIKRRTGSGTINLTQDNGGTWTAVTVTSAWTRVELASATAANPIVGIRIVSSGDAIDVQFFQHELGAFTTSPIPTTSATVTRAADSISIATTAFRYSTAIGSCFAQFDCLGFITNTNPVVAIDANGRWLYVGSDALVKTYDGANIAVSAGTVAVNTVTKAASSMGSSNKSLSLSGASTVTGSFDNTMGTGTYNIGSGYVGAYLNGHMRQLMHLPRALSDPELRTITS